MDNLDQLHSFLFGKLDQSYYCNFFLVLTVFGFVFFLGSVFVLIYGICHNVGFTHYLKAAMISFFYFVFYLESRILYSMCSGKLTSV